MRLLVHLLRTDLRQFRWTIAGWCVLVIADTLLTGVQPSFAADLHVYGNLFLIASLLWYAMQVGMLVIVPLVIQAHPAVGTEAFWMTRPVPRAALVASKLLLLATLMVVVPGAARLALMMWIHVPLREALSVTADGAVARAAWLAILAAGASVTLNLPRFALLCGAAFVSLVLFILVSLMRARVEDSSAMMVAVSPMPAGLSPDDPTLFFLLLVCVAAAGLAVVAIQYRTRLRRWSMPTGIGSVVLAFYALPHWPFPFLMPASAMPAWVGEATAVQLRAASPEIRMAPVAGWIVEGAPALRHGGTQVVVTGLKPGWLPRMQLLEASFTLDNGAVLASRGRGSQSMPQIEGFTENPSRVVVREVLGAAQVYESGLPDSDLVTTLVLPAGESDAVMPAAGKYRGSYGVYLQHFEAVGALPLRPGSAFQDGSYRFAIEQVNPGPDERLSIRAREWRATSWFDRKPNIGYALYVRNAVHSHAMAGSPSSPFEGMGAASAILPFGFAASSGGQGGFFVRAAVVSFPPPYGFQGQKPEWDPAWYADAELVVVRITDAGAVFRSLEMPRASLVASPRGANDR